MSEKNEVEWAVERRDDDVLVTVTDDVEEGGDILYFTMSPDGAAMLASALFDAAQGGPT